MVTGIMTRKTCLYDGPLVMGKAIPLFPIQILVYPTLVSTIRGTVTVSVDVMNTGSRFAKEVVQLYIADRTGTPERPEKELKGFVKLSLEPGKTKTAKLTVNARSLSWYHEELGDWYAAPGNYELLLAHSSRDIRASISLEFTTQKFPPLKIDRNTTIGALLADPRTAPIIQEFCKKTAGLLSTDSFDDGEKSSVASEAISAEMNRQMAINSPFRSAESFLGMSRSQVTELIDHCNRAISK